MERAPRGKRPGVRARIRRAGPEDVDGLLRIEEEVFPGDPFSPAQMRYLLRSQRAVTLIAEAGRRPAGFIAIWWRHGSSTSRIIDLAVGRGFRRRGLGGALVRAALRDGRRRGFAGMTLEVEEHNRAAIALYSEMGFRRERHLPHYYGRRRHALRMVRWYAP